MGYTEDNAVFAVWLNVIHCAYVSPLFYPSLPELRREMFVSPVT
jgi:hypothetical protein